MPALCIEIWKHSITRHIISKMSYIKYTNTVVNMVETAQKSTKTWTRTWTWLSNQHTMNILVLDNVLQRETALHLSRGGHRGCRLKTFPIDTTHSGWSQRRNRGVLSWASNLNKIKIELAHPKGEFKPIMNVSNLSISSDACHSTGTSHCVSVGVQARLRGDGGIMVYKLTDQSLNHHFHIVRRDKFQNQLNLINNSSYTLSDYLSLVSSNMVKTEHLILKGRQEIETSLQAETLSPSPVYRVKGTM